MVRAFSVQITFSSADTLCLLNDHGMKAALNTLAYKLLFKNRW